MADKNIDTTRSENQQRNAANDAGGGKEGYGSERGTPEHNHHSHQEGNYEKE